MLVLLYEQQIKAMHRGRGFMNEKTVQINGTIYDKATGLPIRRTESAPAVMRSNATSVHRTLQKSTTLNRRYVQRRSSASTAPQAASQAVAASAPAPVAAKVESRPKTAATPGAQAVEVKRSPIIQKYAKHPVSPKPAAKKAERPAPAVIHPMVQQVHAARAAQKPAVKKVRKPSDLIKAEAIQAALDSAAATKKQRPARRPKQPAKRQSFFGRGLSLASGGAALLLIAGYFTYINMPSLSVRVAAVQAGVQADYPGYRPSGYSLAGPVSFSDGVVAMNFDSNGTDQQFTLTQTRSGWDSTAVYENYVAPRIGDGNYTTTTSGGLTIYSWNGNAAWINNGVLFTIDGDAPLTPDQIQRLAASM